MTEFQQPIVQRATDLALRQRIATAFARGAASYDANAGLQRVVADRLLAQLPAQSISAALDLGCGTGYCTAALRERLPLTTLYALDLVPAMLASTRQRLADKAANLVCGTADALPLGNDSLDLVLSSLTLQWCNDPAGVFAELHRVLRPGGHALLTTLGPATLQELRAAWTSAGHGPHGNAFVPAVVLQQAAGASGFGVTFTTDTHWRHYESLQQLARELKGLGANVLRDGAAASPSQFKTAAEAFASGRGAQGIPVQWEVFTLVLRKQEA